jgi:hypothetical protein
MAHDASELSPDENTRRERVEELTWAMVDEQINAGEFELLDSLLLSDDAARETYLGCVQLHVDLMHFFADAEAKKVASKSTSVMGFLGEATPPTGFQPPVAERN